MADSPVEALGFDRGLRLALDGQLTDRQMLLLDDGDAALIEKNWLVQKTLRRLQRRRRPFTVWAALQKINQLASQPCRRARFFAPKRSSPKYTTYRTWMHHHCGKRAPAGEAR